jgi:hypothetical protein
MRRQRPRAARPLITCELCIPQVNLGGPSRFKHGSCISTNAVCSALDMINVWIVESKSKDGGLDVPGAKKL